MIGVDAEPLALAQARLARKHYLLGHEPTFDCATFEDTWVPPEFARAVMSTDALYLAPRPPVALAEVHRILATAGVLLFNVFVTRRIELVARKAFVRATGSRSNIFHNR